MKSKEKILFFAAIILFFSSCSAPQIDEGFLNEEYYTNTTVAKTNGSLKLQSKVDSLILELNRVQFRLLQMQLDYLTLSNNMMNLQLHASELKLLQHLKEHELSAEKEQTLPEITPSGNLNPAPKTTVENTGNLSAEVPEKSKSDQGPQNQGVSKVISGIDKRRTLVFDNIYEEGILLFNNKKYTDAREKFDTVLNLEIKDEDLVDNSYYWLGECYYALGSYIPAIENFKKVIEIKESNKIPDALIMLGQTYEKLGWKELAEDTYNKFIQQYPKNKYIPLAKARLKNLD